jgi:asparagine synthase (glutamine-hydrolysing)
MTPHWDGRLDNREELKRELGLSVRTPTDVALVTHVYRRWGINGIARLAGDFALALWDGDGTLRLARDCAGTRPLYYTLRRGQVLWSSSLREVLDAVGDTAIDDDYLASFVAGRPLAGSTPYVGIHAVKPAHVVSIAGGRALEQRFWSIESTRDIRYGSDEEYERHFLELFREAVRCRLHGEATVCAHLSGGLDSSSIVCVADRVLREEGRPPTDLQTVSYVFDEATSADERTWIRAVEAHRGIEGWHISDREAPFWAPHPEPAAFTTPNRLLIASAFDTAVRRRMAAVGSRVLLSGHGGDHMLCSVPLPPPHLPNLLRRGHLRTLHRELHLWALATRQPYVRVLWRNAIRNECAHDIGVPPWLTRRFADRIRSLEKPRDLTLFATAVAQVEMEGRHEPPGIEVTYPYLDRRLVAFLVGIPYEQRVKPGEPRSLMRRALRGILPEAVRLRRCKGNPTAFIARGLTRARAEILALLTDARIVERGLVKPREFREAVERAMHTGETHSASVMLLLRVELWLRLLEGRRAAAGFNHLRPDHDQEVTNVATV